MQIYRIKKRKKAQDTVVIIKTVQNGLLASGWNIENS